MKEFVISEAKTETAVLVALITPAQDEAKTKEYLDELEFLATTAGARTVRRFTQKVNGPSAVTYVGSGKLQEIRQYIKDCEEAEEEVGMVIFDDELTAKQMRNIEKELKVKILDRTLSARAAVQVAAAARAPWDCAALVRHSSRWTAASSCTASPC